MRRREFFLGSLASIVFVACGSESSPPGGVPTGDGGRTDGSGNPPPDVDQTPPPPTSSPDASNRAFPQGLASGDPRPDRVLLWTRVEPASVGKGADDDIELDYVIAQNEDLTGIMARGTVTAKASSDHTVRLVPTELESGRHYYYRFASGTTTTQVGRTKTAPAPDADVPVSFVMAACQDYIGRWYHSWKAFLEEKVEVDFIMYLGDYIYETVNDARFQSSDPGARAIKLPDGIDTSEKQDGSRIAASTLADYRTLYKTYKQDEHLREVHRRFPFVFTWDDHEFADDCWQDHSTSFNGKDPKTGKADPDDEKNTPRRTNANRAFFEFQAIDVTYKSNLTFPFDIEIFRQLRFGKNVDLFMTDQRSYRADHLTPEGEGADPAVGKFTDFTMIGSRYFIRKSGFDKKEADRKPSLLGAKQKAWLLDAVKKSDATWKVWGNEVQMYQMCLDLTKLPGVPDTIFGVKPYTVYINGDQWDGYRSERAEILKTWKSAGVKNLLVCTGDIHSFYAAELHENFDAPGSEPLGVEYVTAGISSASLKELMSKFVSADSPLAFVVNAWTGAADKALTDTNAPFLRYANTNSYGFALMTVDSKKVETTFVVLGVPTEKTYGGVKGRVKFVTDVDTHKVKLL